MTQTIRVTGPTNPMQRLLRHGCCPCPKCNYELLPVLSESSDGRLNCSECGHETSLYERSTTLTAGDTQELRLPWFTMLLPSVLLASYALLVAAAYFELLLLTVPIVLGGLLMLTMCIAAHALPSHSRGTARISEVADLVVGLMMINVAVAFAIFAAMAVIGGCLAVMFS